MNTKTSFFNKSIFKKNMLQALPYMAALAGLLLLVEISSISNLFDVTIDMTTQELQEAVSYRLIDMPCTLFVKFILACYSFFSGMLMFRYLFKKKLSLTIHSLPVTRTCLYITNIISGLLAVLLPIIAAAAVIGIYVTAHGLGCDMLLVLIALLFSFCLIFYSLAVITAVITGHLLASPIIYIFLNFGIIFAQLIFAAIPSLFYFGVSDQIDKVPTIFSPFVHLHFYIHTQHLNMKFAAMGDTAVDSRGLHALMIYAAASVLLLAAGWLLYKKRRLETFGDPIVTKKLQPFFLYAGTFFGGTLGGILLFELFSMDKGTYSLSAEGAVFLLLFFLLASILVYFIATMLLKKTIHVFKSSYKGILVYLAAAAVILSVFYADPLNIEEKMPAQNEVASVALSYESGQHTFTKKEDIQAVLDIQKAILEHKDVLSEEMEGNAVNAYLSITYNLKDDKTMDRWYLIPYVPEDTDHMPVTLSKETDEIRENIKKLFNDPDVISAQMQSMQPYLANYHFYSFDEDFDEAQEISYDSGWNGSQEEFALLTAVKKDIKAGKIKFYFGDEASSGREDFQYALYFYAYNFNANFSSSAELLVTKDCEDTLEALQQLIDKYGAHGPGGGDYVDDEIYY